MNGGGRPGPHWFGDEAAGPVDTVVSVDFVSVDLDGVSVLDCVVVVLVVLVALPVLPTAPGAPCGPGLPGSPCGPGGPGTGVGVGAVTTVGGVLTTVGRSQAVRPSVASRIGVAMRSFMEFSVG